MKLYKNAVKTCEQLLTEYAMKDVSVTNTQKIKFTGVEHKDVYNITAPFQDEGEWVIAGRVESRDSEHSNVVFFVERDGQWIPREGAPIFELQDPFFTKINGELIVGGVQIYPHPVKADALMWRTVFYRGKNIASLALFFKGPDGMKDLRLVDLKDSIGVLTRPQGDKGGRGKIGFTRIASLEALSIPLIEETPLLEGQFVDEEWGGANEAHLLKNGLLGVLGHIASFDEAGDRHYYPMVFAIDPATGEYSDIQLIAVRNQFLPGATKRPDLADVVFSGGLVRYQDGTAHIYAGISDAEAQRAVIPDPFAQFEVL